ncbi:MAG TPA: DoxX family protein [Candidatus Nanoarchaeia archaeon]|nr:DoxX family protein [Candidatus Nanoarchaeia archaeon]
MKPKTIKILYWIITIIFALFMLFSGISEVMQTQPAKDLLIQLGYPIYLNFILGIAKVLGVIAIVQTKFKVIKEWAYAGFTIDITGASASMALNGIGVASTLFTLVFLAPLFISYFLGKRVERLR